MTRALKQKGIHNAIWGKRRMKLVEFTTKVSKVPIFLNFRQHSPNFRPFPKSYLQSDLTIRKLMGSGLKRLATGSVSKRYQTSLFAQLSETIVPYLSSILFLNKLQAKTLDMENTFQRKMFQAISRVRRV